MYDKSVAGKSSDATSPDNSTTRWPRKVELILRPVRDRQRPAKYDDFETKFVRMIRRPRDQSDKPTSPPDSRKRKFSFKPNHVEFETSTTKSEVDKRSEVMPKRKRQDEFPCYVCGLVFSRYYNRKRHLAKYGVNEREEKLSEKERQRLLGYNKHKNKKKSEAKTGTSAKVEDASASSKMSKPFKSVKFISSCDGGSDSRPEDSSSESASEVVLATKVAKLAIEIAEPRIMKIRAT